MGRWSSRFDIPYPFISSFENYLEQIPGQPAPYTRFVSTATQKLIFIVDDEETIASTMATILRTRGFDCRTFGNAFEALAAAKNGSPDVLITDLLMPGMSGYDLALRLRTTRPDIRVFILTGLFATAELTEQIREAGSDFEIVEKPILPPKLIAAIERATSRDTVS